MRWKNGEMKDLSERELHMSLQSDAVPRPYSWDKEKIINGDDESVVFGPDVLGPKTQVIYLQSQEASDN